jgi:hypothetical protein
MPEPLADWVGIIGTGQSLSVGVGAPPISTIQPYNNLKLLDSGPDPRYPLDGGGDLSLVPLTEPIKPRLSGYSDQQYPNNIFGETPNTAMANEISALWLDRTGGDYVTIHAPVGWSGHCLRDIDKRGTGRAYPGTLSEGRSFQRLANEAGKTFAFGAVILTHGECDATNPGYEDGLYQLWQDYNEDLKAITGQSQDLPLLVSQQSTIVVPRGGSSAAVWRLGIDHPGQGYCVGPKYQYQYNSDHLHMDAAGYRRLGEKYAEVYDLVVNQAVFWKPLQPNTLVRDGARITVYFDVPNPPLNWDENISRPHQEVHTAWANGRGFEVSDSTGELTITSVEIVGDDVLEITLDREPTGTNLLLRYALTQDGTGIQGGTELGMRGQLRDSDAPVGYDVETLECNVTNGSTAVTSASPGAFAGRTGHDIVEGDQVPDGTVVKNKDNPQRLTLSSPWPGPTGTAFLTFHHDQHNYCAQFELAVP